MCGKWTLIPISNPDLNWTNAESIELPDGTPLKIGRSRQTLITDPSCAREQLILTANDDKLTIQPIGPNCSALNGLSLIRNETYEVGKEEGNLEVLLGKHTYFLKFTKDNGLMSNGKKRKIDDVHESTDRNEATSSTNKKKNNISQYFSSPKECKVALEKITNFNDLAVSKIDNGSLYILTFRGVKSSTKIAAFDLDGTLIKTKSGNKFPKDAGDWQLFHASVAEKLKCLHADNYKIVLFTNQAPIGMSQSKFELFKGKIENIAKRLDVPMQVFIATGKDAYRKPRLGMWESLVEHNNSNLEIDMGKSFYCGDAAGRKKDHSFTDRFFAENVGLKFYTPEMYFLKAAPVPYEKPSFDVKSINRKHKSPNLIVSEKEILVMVGYPGCGKSTFAKQIEAKSKNNYAIVCQDVIGAWQKCVKHAEKFLEDGKSVIVDSTNLTKESRNRWISLAKRLNVVCRCLYHDISLPHCKHNNKYRQEIDKNHKIVTDIVYNDLKKKFEEPTVGEGFAELVPVKFIPTFGSESQEKKYFQHYLEN